MPAPKGFVTNPTGKNQWVDEAGQGERSKTIAFRPLLEVSEQINNECEARGITKSQWLDEASQLKLVLGENYSSRLPLIKEAIALALDLKRAALSREQKKKKPDTEAVAKWQHQIEDLESLL